MSRKWLIRFGVLGLVALLAIAFLAGGLLMRAPWRTLAAPWNNDPTPGYDGTCGTTAVRRGGMWGGMGGGYGGTTDGICPGTATSTSAEPLTLDQASQAVESYVASLGNDDLEVAEVMIFDNQAYAEIVEMSTGIGAMEVLVDPGTLAVVPEHGPNMMWNLKYGMMAGGTGWTRGGMMGGRRGGMMGYSYAPSQDVDTPMSVSPQEALDAAQQYLDANNTGLQAADAADPFYGYYTIHTLRDGKVVGMLSVNGYNSQVWLHTWHGTFIEMSEDHS